jgi:hypothetical protein
VEILQPVGNYHVLKEIPVLTAAMTSVTIAYFDGVKLQHFGVVSVLLVHILQPLKICEKVHNVVGMTGYGLGDRGVGVRVRVGSRIFSSPRRPDRL